MIQCRDYKKFSAKCIFMIYCEAILCILLLSSRGNRLRTLGCELNFTDWMSNLSFNPLDECSRNPNAKCQETFIIEVAEKTKKKFRVRPKCLNVVNWIAYLY